MCFTYLFLGWVGLGWVGLGWVGLGGVGLGWVGWGWVGLLFDNIACRNSKRGTKLLNFGSVRVDFICRVRLVRFLNRV